ncbi:MAG: energy transducer TonB [Bacteroidales bacterium]|nr:energy transducer TonB [Bacteroidales bacterium]
MNKYIAIFYLRFCISVLLLIFFSSTFLFSQNFIPAEIIGGKKQFKEFIEMEMQFPDKSIKEKVKGNVELSFIINKNGEIIDINIEESVNNEIDNEAIRILKKTLWIPAMKFGKFAASREKLLIHFNYKKYNRLCKRRGYNKLKYLYLPIDTCCIVFDKKEINKSPSPIFEKRFYSLDKFINDNIKYPDAAFNQNISGQVILNFIVEPYGQVSHITIEKYLGGGCNEEAIRVLKLLKWNPGLKENKAVRVRMSIKVTFNLPDGSDHRYLPNNQNNTL